MTTALSTNQEFLVYNEAGSVGIVVDVSGYYVDHDDRYYTRAEADDRFRANTSSEIHLGVADFTAEPPGTSWSVNDSLWTRTAGSTACLAAPLDIAVGQSVDRVDIRYLTMAAAQVGVFVSSLIRTPITGAGEEALFDLHLVDQERELPPSGGASIGEVSIATDSDDADSIAVTPVAADHDVAVRICSDSALVFLNATVVLS